MNVFLPDCKKSGSSSKPLYGMEWMAMKVKLFAFVKSPDGHGSMKYPR